MARGPRGGPSRYERDFFNDYLERMDLADRMGMHDLSEHYGRYSGGSPYSYEYSERAFTHRRLAGRGPIGFTRSLAPARRQGRGARRPPRPRPRPRRARPGAWGYRGGW